ncbi:hypothetical protein TSUD_94240 [Trifolium subterraneum]|uniref:Uncharacterized protein n=1 Tax=Trifolium subterraneum TaxID=3900 RepID=A0A2Z6NIE9_TRISU|nr:hypothetical protein TSUD_94240 [Trifolium subterraneum]
MEGNCLQMLHCVKHGICRTLPHPHTCVSPPCTLAEVLVILVESHLDKNKGFWKKLPHYFTSTIDPSLVAVKHDDTNICTYPLHSIVILSLFTIISSCYLVWIGIQILKLAINKAFVFLAFLAHVCCSGLCMYTLVYRPIADCLAMRNLQYLKARTRRFNDDDIDTVIDIANESHMEDNVEENARPNLDRYYD